MIANPPLIVPIADLVPKQVDQETFATQIQDLIARYRRTLETDRRFLVEQYGMPTWPARSSAWAASEPAAGSSMRLAGTN